MRKASIFVLASVVGPLAGLAQAEPAERGHGAATPLEGALDVQYYWPLHDDRRICSVFVDASVGLELVRLVHLSAFVGLTSTAAWGSIVQLGDHFQKVGFDTTALGLGPVLTLRLQPLAVWRVRVGLDAVGSLLVYGTRFPPGGDVYNFSWRAGPSLRVALGERVSLTASFRWMHVSNGQGLGPQNPSYEGAGPALGVTASFW